MFLFEPLFSDWRDFSMLNFYRAATLAATFAATTFLAAAISPAQAMSFQTTVGGIDYDITTREGTFNALRPELEESAFFGDFQLADDLASELGVEFGSPNFGFLGPLFIYESREVGFGGFYRSVDTINNNIRNDFWPEFQEATFAFATSTTEPEQVPTPALLPGLLGVGVAALRKRKASLAESTAA